MISNKGVVHEVLDTQMLQNHVTIYNGKVGHISTHG